MLLGLFGDGFAYLFLVGLFELAADVSSVFDDGYALLFGGGFLIEQSPYIVVFLDTLGHTMHLIIAKLLGR
jgi:hypothetical protein